MNKTLIAYYSKYGHTKQYVQWLAEELNADICEIKNLNFNNLKDYSTVIFGSSIYAGQNKAAVSIVKHFKQLKNKKIVLFTCGLTDTSSEAIIADRNQQLETAIPPEIKEKIKIFHLRGGMDYENLNFLHKTIMKMLFKSLSKKPVEELTEKDKDILTAYGQKVDFSNKEMLQPIIAYCLEG
jgi:menaquinone-dependent protoporphyrinogen IX oxidase